MKTALAFVFLAVCFSVQAVKLSEIDKTDFGKNLLDTVYLELKTGDNAQTVLELLQEVEDQVIQEQDAHNARHTETQLLCDRDIAEYNLQIETAQADESLAQSRLDGAYPERQRVEGLLADNKENLRQTEETLADATALIEEQRAEFERHEAELIDAIQVFNEASRLIKQAFGQSASFIQTEAGSSLAAHFDKIKLNAKYAPFAKLLAQAASSNKLSQSAVQNILDLIQRLINNAQKTLSGERQTMQAREDAYALFSAQLEEAITNFKRVIGDLSAELEILNNKITQWEGDLADAKQRFATFTQKLADRTAICDAEEREYVVATERRNGDLKIINEVEALISERVADFTQYITSTRDEIHID